MSRIPTGEYPDRAAFRGSAEDAFQLLEAARSVIKELIKDTRVVEGASPVLIHPDFHARNVFVASNEPTKVIGVIDWQGARIEPAFMSALDTPDFATVLGALPFLAVDDERERKAADICATAFDAIMRGSTLKFRAARRLDEIMIRIFQYCVPAWTTGATALRQELIDLSREWTKLKLPGTCPYVPTDEEISLHEKLFVDLEDATKLKSGIVHLLNANGDGYVQNRYWKEAETLLPELRRQWIESATQCGTSEDEAKKIFPFEGNESIVSNGA